KRHEVPAHHNAEAYLDAYLEASALHVGRNKDTPLFQTLNREGRLTGQQMHRVDVLRMVKRRARRAGLPSSTCCHTFRATGITAYLENGGTIENAQAIAAHDSPRTTKLTTEQRSPLVSMRSSASSSNSLETTRIRVLHEKPERPWPGQDGQEVQTLGWFHCRDDRFCQRR